ncbi:MAG: hypothetical protein ACTMHH_05705 [Nesterenkonia sp.]
MRTTVDIPDELMRKAKVRSAEQGETLKELFVRVLEREVSTSVASRGFGEVQLPLVGQKGDSPAVRSLTNAQIEDLLTHSDAQGVLG